MFANQLGHLKHRNFLFPSEYCLQVGISNDVSLIYLILELIFLDIFPKFFGNFCSWEWLTPDNLCQFLTNLHGFHECRIWLSLFLDNRLLGGLLCNRLLSSLLLYHFFLLLVLGYYISITPFLSTDKYYVQKFSIVSLTG